MTLNPGGRAVAPGQAVGYIRVSTTEQNVVRQVATIGEVDRVFTDKVSGAKGAVRPELENLIAYVRAGDTVRVASLDRLARSLVDLERIVGVLLDKGVRVEFVTNHLTFEPGEADKYATFQRQVLASVAELERAIIKERQREGIAAAKARGVYRGRRPALSPEDAEQVRGRHAAGVPMTRLATDYGCSRRVIFDVVHRRGVYALPGEGRAG